MQPSLLTKFLRRANPIWPHHSMLRMHMNVFYLQQRLSSLLQTEEDEMQFERVYTFYALVEVRVPTLV